MLKLCRDWSKVEKLVMVPMSYERSDDDEKLEMAPTINKIIIIIIQVVIPNLKARTNKTFLKNPQDHCQCKGGTIDEKPASFT